MRESVISYLQDRMTIDDNGSLSYLLYSEICYINYVDYYTHIITVEKDDILICCSLSKLLNNLPAVFVLCNKSTIVNLSYAKSIKLNGSESFLLLENDRLLHISRRKSRDVKEKFQLIDNCNLSCRDCFKCELSRKSIGVKK